MHVLQGHSETPEEEEDGRIAASLAGGVKGEWRGPMQILHVFCVLGLTNVHLEHGHEEEEADISYEFAWGFRGLRVKQCSAIEGGWREDRG